MASHPKRNRSQRPRENTTMTKHIARHIRFVLSSLAAVGFGPGLVLQ